MSDALSEQRPSTGKVALVTGSSSGIGAETARRLGALGYAVVCNGVGNDTLGRAVVSSLPDGLYVDADVSDTAQVEAMVAEAAAWRGRLDVVVNSAGVAVQVPHRDLNAATDELWERLLGINLVGTWKVCRAAAPHLTAVDGCIVNVASIAGLSVSGSSIPYAVSKAGVVHLTNLLAVAMGPSVRVNAIAPGYIDTPLNHEWEDLREIIRTRAPLARLGQVENAAAAVLALVENDYITGAVLPVDGGMRLA